MLIRAREQIDLSSEDQVVRVRHIVRQRATELGFSLIEQTKLVTAASELARNTVIHGGGGHVELEVLEDAPRRGLRLSFIDSGKGIEDIALALRDGYTTGGGLGLGLGGAKRLVHDFEIESHPGRGTRVTIARWR